MFRAKARSAEPVAVATSQELLRAAMHRSARRNARVATWRVAWRWLLWGSGHLARLAGIAILVATPLAGAWYLWQERGAAERTASVTPASPPRQASMATSAPAGPPASAADAAETQAQGMRLRLDDSVTQPEVPPAAQSDTNINPNRPTTP